tara:strand:+ start:180 stop:530 length:351 start_codon:yes stop_codon:yes gene_type:complete
MRLRTIFGFERFMATKKSSKKAEEPVVEKAAPKKEKAPAKPKMLVGLEHKPHYDESQLELKDFIVASYHSMLGRDPTEGEMKHHLMTVEVHRRPRRDIHIDLCKSGEYQGRHDSVS